jgi:hypothetical protein
MPWCGFCGHSTFGRRFAPLSDDRRGEYSARLAEEGSVGAWRPENSLPLCGELAQAEDDAALCWHGILREARPGALRQFAEVDVALAVDDNAVRRGGRPPGVLPIRAKGSPCRQQGPSAGSVPRRMVCTPMYRRSSSGKSDASIPLSSASFSKKPFGSSSRSRRRFARIGSDDAINACWAGCSRASEHTKGGLSPNIYPVAPHVAARLIGAEAFSGAGRSLREAALLLPCGFSPESNLGSYGGPKSLI